MTPTPPPPPAQPPFHPLALPSHFSPDAIDALSELSVVLGKLEPTITSNSQLSQSQTVVNGNGSIPLTQPTPATTTDDPNSSAPAPPLPRGGSIPPIVPASSSPSSPSHHQHSQQHLQQQALLLGVQNIGDLPLRNVATSGDEIKHKLQRARTQISLLPDMSRTLAQQEEEISYLEDRMRAQKRVLDMLKGVRSEGLGLLEEEGGAVGLDLDLEMGMEMDGMGMGAGMRMGMGMGMGMGMEM